MKKLMGALCMLLLIFSIHIYNGSDNLILYRCLRYDHNIPEWGNRPLQYAVGELQPGHKVVIEDREGQAHQIVVYHNYRKEVEQVTSYYFEGDVEGVYVETK